MTAAESFTPQLLCALRKVTVNKTQAESDATVSTPSFLVSQELGEEGSQEGITELLLLTTTCKEGPPVQTKPFSCDGLCHLNHEPKQTLLPEVALLGIFLLMETRNSSCCSRDRLKRQSGWENMQPSQES